MLKVVAAVFVATLLSSASIAFAAEADPTPEDVTFVQGLLKRMGYDPGPADGICGNLTTAAVRAFHEARDLPLEPGHIEPQAATVVKNLTEAFAEHVMQPQGSAADVYRQALAGDADAALEVGRMYRHGESVAADEMLAYAWWSVAETHGNKEAASLKNDVAEAGNITDHEIGYATALAEQICTSVHPGGDHSSPANASSKPEPTM